MAILFTFFSNPCSEAITFDLNGGDPKSWMALEEEPFILAPVLSFVV